MVGYKDSSDVAKKAAKVARNNWPEVNFFHDGNEVTTSMEHSFKTKGTKSSK